MIVLMLALALTACGSPKSVGDWTGVYMESEGMKVKLAGFMEMKISFKADKTAVVDAGDGDVITGSWEGSGNSYKITVEDESVDVKLDKDVLIFSAPDIGTVYFTKNPDSFKYPDDAIGIDELGF